jgi:flagellum-specific peptidoglycan hydrolase FlgJ
MKNNYPFESFARVLELYTPDHYDSMVDYTSDADSYDDYPDLYTTFSGQITPYFTYNNPASVNIRQKKKKNKSTKKDRVVPEAEKPIVSTTVVQQTPKTSTTPSVEQQTAEIAQAFTPAYITVNGKKVRDVVANKNNFVKTFLPVYRKVLKEKGISEDFAEALVAQAALESA